MRHTVTLMLVLLSLAVKLFGQTASGKNAGLTVARTADFEVRGDTLGASWQATSWINLTRHERSGPSYTTRIKVLYSESGLYCLYWCEDKTITATLREDFTNLFKEDVVEVFLWPDEATPIYLEYELSPLNHELVLLVPNLKEEFFGWRPWHYEGKRATRHQVKQGAGWWCAEVFIPYELLRPLNNVPPKPGTRWRANFYRIDYDQGMTKWAWQPIVNNFHDFELYGTLVFAK